MFMDVSSLYSSSYARQFEFNLLLNVCLSLFFCLLLPPPPSPLSLLLFALVFVCLCLLICFFCLSLPVFAFVYPCLYFSLGLDFSPLFSCNCIRLFLFVCLFLRTHLCSPQNWNSGGRKEPFEGKIRGDFRLTSPEMKDRKRRPSSIPDPRQGGKSMTLRAMCVRCACVCVLT